MSAIEAVDLFAGTGWGVALQRLGIREHGVENMPAAIATREANGMRTWMEDVWDVLAHAPLDSPEFRAALLIASPPCQTFSMAGKGDGRKALGDVLEAIAERAYLDPERLRAFGQKHDDRTALVLTPLAYVAQHLPRLVVLEQVPTVLPVWEACAEEMRRWGYSVVTGVLNAEQYGVPQTRRRAILVARWDKEARMPTPTHSLYHNRNRTHLDEGVLPWVSMAEALGWGMTERPYVTVAAGTASGGTDPAYLGGSGARRLVKGERADGRWVAEHVMGSGMVERHGTRPPRELNEPAFTIRASAGGMEPHGFRWAYERPATTIAGDARVWPPGHKINAADIRRLGEAEARERYGDRADTEVIRLTAEEAACIQTYPAGFQWQGGKGDVAQQIGNAVPPLMAEAILKTLLD